MARKDVLTYYKQVEEQYLEMLQDAKDYDEAYKNGQITEEQFNQAVKSLEIVKINYERLSFVIFLLNAPARDKKKAKYNKMNSKVLGALEDSTVNAVVDENADALKSLKEIIKGAK